MRLENPGSGSIEVVLGTTFEVILDDLPGAGYLWDVTCSGGLELHSETEAEGAPAGPDAAVGGAARRRWTVTATAPGPARLHGAFARPWEAERPEQEFTLEVRVTERPG